MSKHLNKCHLLIIDIFVDISHIYLSIYIQYIYIITINPISRGDFAKTSQPSPTSATTSGDTLGQLRSWWTHSAQPDQLLRVRQMATWYHLEPQIWKLWISEKYQIQWLQQQWLGLVCYIGNISVMLVRNGQDSLQMLRIVRQLSPVLPIMVNNGRPIATLLMNHDWVKHSSITRQACFYMLTRRSNYCIVERGVE